MSNNQIVCHVGVKSGSLTISGPAIIYNTLDLEGYTDIRRLPSNLTIFGNLYLIGTKIIEIPDNLIVFGNVDLEGCDTLEKIGSGVSIKGNLNLEHCSSLREVPCDLQVNGSIFR